MASKQELLDQEAIQHLLSAYNILAPNSKDQAKMANTVIEMRRVGESDRTICKAITAGIFDGLAYGNWPSAVEAMQNRQC